MATRGRKPGTPKTGGRTKGKKNARSVEHAQLMQEVTEKLEAVMPNCYKGDAHSLLIAVYKDTNQPWPMRIDAAKAAIRFEVPALANLQHKEDDEQFRQKHEDMDLMETARRMAFIFATADEQETAH